MKIITLIIFLSSYLITFCQNLIYESYDFSDWYYLNNSDYTSETYEQDDFHIISLSEDTIEINIVKSFISPSGEDSIMIDFGVKRNPAEGEVNLYISKDSTNWNFLLHYPNVVNIYDSLIIDGSYLNTSGSQTYFRWQVISSEYQFSTDLFYDNVSFKYFDIYSFGQLSNVQNKNEEQFTITAKNNFISIISESNIKSVKAVSLTGKNVFKNHKIDSNYTEFQIKESGIYVIHLSTDKVKNLTKKIFVY